MPDAGFGVYGLLLPFVVALIVPFFIAQFMHNKKWLAVFSILTGGVVFYLYYDFWHTPIQHRGNGVSQVIGLAALEFFSYSTLFGVATRAVTLFLESRQCSRRVRFFAAIIGLLSMFFALGIPSLLEAWRLRPPDQNCQYKNITIHLGQTALTLAVTPVLSFSTGNGTSSAGGALPESGYYFTGSQDIRRFCDDYTNGKREIHANLVAIRFSDWSQASSRSRPICSDDNAKWPHELCFKSQSAPDAFYFQKSLFYPLELYVYMDGKYDSKTFGVTKATFDEFSTKKESLVIAADLPGFLFDPSNHQYFWRSSILAMQGSNGQPIILECSLPSNNSQFCRTDYALKRGLRVTYTMLLDPTNVEQNLHMIHRKVHEFLWFSGVE